MHSQRVEISGRLNRIDRRMKTLDEHLRQAGHYREHRAVYMQYQAIQNPKQRAKFREENGAAIALYEAAKRYLDGVKNGRAALPVKAWRAERDTLAAERSTLNREYVSLKAEVQKVERVRRAAEDIMREDAQRVQAFRERDMAM